MIINNLRIFFEERSWVKYTSYQQQFDSIEEYLVQLRKLHSSLGFLRPLEMEIKLRGFIKKLFPIY